MSDPIEPAILVVDDDRVFRERLARALRDRGHTVHTAAHGPEGLEIARRERPARAILDLRMPGMNGLEVLTSLREIIPETRVLVLTGYGSIANAVEAMRLGAASYLPKPADADEILSALLSAQTPPAEDPADLQSAPSLARAEWEHINRVLADCNGNISEAARRLGIHRRSLQRKLQRYPPRR